METQIEKLHRNKNYNAVLDIWKVNKVSEMDSTETLTINNPFLIDILNQSTCVTWILDLRTQKFTFVSDNTLEIFGYDSADYIRDGQMFHEGIKHPDDTVNSWKLVYNIWHVLSHIPSTSRSGYKFSHDYRIIKPDGKVARLLEQSSVLQQDSDGNITHLLGVCTDITQWKRNGTQLASLSSANEKQYFLFNSDHSESKNSKSILSKRELEILKLISQGHSSKYIADKLFISFHTVNTHRQKMIEKTNTKNTGGLVQFAVCNGLI